MRTDDGYIIYKCLNGDPDAFGLLVDKYKAGVYALAYSRLRNFHDAQDVAQEVFIRAYENLHKLRRWESFAGWLYRITSRQCRNWIRAQSKRPDNEFLEDSDAGMLDSRSMDSYQSELVSQSVHDALDSLPEVHRQLLALRYLGGMNSFEIARFVGVSPAAVRRRLVNARAALKAEMLDTMSEVFEEQRLQSIFTLRILEMVKHIRVQPLTRLAEIGWGLSIALGIMITVFGSGSFIKLQNYIDASASELTGSTGSGEIPLTFIEQTGEWEGDASMLKSKKMSVAAVFAAMVGILSGNAMSQTEWTGYEVNPVLAKGADGTWDDEGFFKPGVLFLPGSEPYPGRGYKMYYGAYDGSDWHVGLATSENGIDWIRHTDSNGNPVPLLSGEGSGWDRKSIDCCAVILDDGLYKAWYSGTDGYTHKIGYATSTDGIDWDKYDRNGDDISEPHERIVLDKGDAAWESKSVYWPAVLVVENAMPYPEHKHKMWYSATDGSRRRIGLATSEDGIHWQKYDKDGDGNPDPVLEPTAGWESLDVFAPNVLYNGTIYRMWYAGHDGSHAKIGYATSEDGIIWQKYDRDGDGNPDPVLDLGGSGEWDNFHVSTPSVMFDGVGYKMWYVGSNGTVLGIGYATAPIDQSVDDYAVLAENSVYLKEKASILSGAVGVNNDGSDPMLTPYELTVGVNVITGPEVKLSATSVSLEKKSRVEGDVCYRDEIFIGEGAVVLGEQEQSSDCFPLVSQMPACPGFSPGANYVEVSQDGYMVLDEGAYGDIMVRHNGNLILTGGEYKINSLDTEDNAKIYLEAPTILRIADKLNTGIKAYFGPHPDVTLTASEIYVHVCGTNGVEGDPYSDPKAAHIGEGGTFYGRLHAVNGTIWIVKKARAIGSFIARDVIVGIGATVSREEDGVAAAPPLIPSTAFKYSDPSAGWYLGQCYPNPFNPETWMPYKLAEEADVVINVYTSAGQLIRTLNLGRKPAGFYTARNRAAYWDGRNEAGEQVSSGIYFYTIQAGGFAATKKMVVAR